MWVEVDISKFILKEDEYIVDTYLTEEDKVNIIHRLASRTFEIAQMWCPVETGTLKASGKLKLLKTGAKITYTEPYAPYVHEIVTNYHRNPTRAKWLQDAFIESIKELIISYGFSNVPTFYFLLTTTPTLQLTFTTTKKGTSWRDFV